jgi:hypothetical protein
MRHEAVMATKRLCECKAKLQKTEAQRKEWKRLAADGTNPHRGAYQRLLKTTNISWMYPNYMMQKDSYSLVCQEHYDWILKNGAEAYWNIFKDHPTTTPLHTFLP